MMETLRMLGPLAWRNIWRNPRRTIITLIVVSAGLYSILLFAALLQAWADSTRERALTVLNGSGQIHAVGFLDDPSIKRLMPTPSDGLKTALNGPDITTWVQRLSVPAVLQSEYRTMPVTLLGVDPARERTISVIPDNIATGQYLSGPGDGEIVLGQKLIDRLKTRVGKRVIVLAQSADGTQVEQSFTVAGAIGNMPEIEDQYGFIGLAAGQKMLATGSRISEIAFRTAGQENLKTALKTLQDAAPALDVRSWKDLSPMAAAIDQAMGLMVLVWLWVMFVLMAFGIINTQLMAVFERIREFGLMQALGMRPRMIVMIVTLESTVLVGLGTIIGMIAATATIRALAGGIDISFFAQGAAMFGAGHILQPQVNPAQLVEFSLVVWVLGVAVTLWPARKAAKSSPVEAMTHVS
jgi:ABC-type lipoprotein release transport system permease subunit